MGILPSDSPVSEGAAKALAKGIKKGFVPEQRMPTPEQIAEAQSRRAEALRPDEMAKPTAKPGILARLRRFLSFR
jgi:hypothetical protein